LRDESIPRNGLPPCSEPTKTFDGPNPRVTSTISFGFEKTKDPVKQGSTVARVGERCPQELIGHERCERLQTVAVHGVGSDQRRETESAQFVGRVQRFLNFVGDA
jgi:hypothetical protein